MTIRFISSLTPEDEVRYGPAVLQALTTILDRLPVAYTVRLETDAGVVFHHTHTPEEQPAEDSSV